MAKYRIPEDYISAFEMLSNYNTETVSILARELEEVRIGANPDEIVENLINKEKVNLPESELRVIIGAIFSSYGLIDREGSITIENMISDLVESFLEIKNDANSYVNLKPNLDQLIRKNSRLDLTYKTFQLISDYDKIYINSKIISDIRIVFNDNLKNNNQEAVIIHQFKIEYHERGEVKNSFFALDINDLKKLKEHINRAIEKEKLIKDNIYGNLSFISLKK